MSERKFVQRAASSVFILWLAMAGFSAASDTFTSLASFDKTNGNEPNHTALIQATDGSLYGVTSYGGANGSGAVFRVSPSGTLDAIYNFCSLAGCADGENPYTSLVQASNGDLYGATYSGGASNNGTLFKITTSGTLTTLYNFCSLAGCADGSGPEGQLAVDAAGNIYGTATNGGASNFGTVFKYSTKGVLTTLHSFSGADGEYPSGGVVAASGAFYGTAEDGGANGYGTVFKITAAGAETTLHSFAGTDGYYPHGWLVDVAGTFYGTTFGTSGSGANSSGTVFKMTAAGTVTTLHSFCSLAACADGATPTAGLMQATDGNLYGVTDIGGANNDGTIYELTLKEVLTTLHSFDNTDGYGPQGALLQDTNGDFYGITEFGGTIGDGTVFSLATGLQPFVTLEITSGKVGSKVGILGDGFSSSSVVKFNGATATTVTLTEPGLLTATVPAGATDGYVTVTTGATTLTSTQKFTVHNSWSSGAPVPVAVVNPAAAVLGGEIYLVGGYNSTGSLADVQIYNPTANTWSTGPSLPTATDTGAAAVVSNQLYFIGGSHGGVFTNAVWAYSPTTKTWTAKAAMPTGRNGLQVVVEKNIIYAIGGYNGSTFVDNVESYNPKTNTWTEEAPMLGTKDIPAVGLIGTTIVVAGGANVPDSVTGDTEAYNATTNEWTELTADPTARTGPCNGVIGMLYDAGGYINNAGAATTVNESFNLTAKKWTTTLAPMPNGTMFSGSAVANGQLYCLAGAAVVNSSAVDYVQIYQP